MSLQRKKYLNGLSAEILLDCLIILFLGGWTENSGDPLDTTEIYRASLGKFIPGPPMEVGLAGSCLIKVDETTFVLTGGKDVTGNFVVSY